MTLTPEERANALADDIFASGHGWTPMGSVEATKLIAKAITQAQNDKLEDAAAAASGAILRALDAGYDRGDTTIAVVVAIRSLKKD